jgi:DNA-binding transcriptional regulator YiaG
MYASPYPRGMADDYAQRIEQWRAQCDDLMRAIEADPSSQRALEAATKLGEVARQIIEEAALLRGRMAMRIRDDEKLSLAVLAERIGVSKARADQLVRAAQNAEKQREDADG